MRRSIAAAIIALVITLIVGQEAMASQTLEEMKQDCEELDAYWQHDPPSGGSFRIPNKAGAAICVGYLAAILDLTGIVEGCPSNCQRALHICPPKGATLSQVLAVFLAHARSHAEQWHQDASLAILNVLSTTFPCNNE
jgi:Rap1a immunity proteins